MRNKLKAKRKKFFEDFKKFVSRGNVVDLAVAVVIGAAFNKIVTQFVASIITPLLSLVIGGLNMNEWKIVLKRAVLAADGSVEKAEIAITYGTLISVILDFLITALCVFIIARIYANVKRQLEEEKNKIILKINEEKIAKQKEEERIKKEEEERAAALAEEKRIEAEKIEAEKMRAAEKREIEVAELLREIRDLLKCANKEQ